MFQYLEKLRRKPEAERKKIVLLMSLCITFIIALIWVTTLSFRVGETDFSIKKEATNKEVPSLKETFSNFIDQVGGIINSDTKYENPGL
jgi:hypothetical protein